MAIRVKLDEIIEGLEFQSDESSSFLDKTTGKVVLISEYQMCAAEDDEPDEDSPDWEQDLVRIAKEIINETGNYIALPTKFDIHEYSIMEKFCLSLNDDEMCDTLYSLIKGSGAFGRFKNAIHEYDIADDWYKYRNDELKAIAIEWCKEHGIELDDK
ncbi:MAG: UPF0158 family protein [Planctomycetota bacterium]|jgi:hypothetical protein